MKKSLTVGLILAFLTSFASITVQGGDDLSRFTSFIGRPGLRGKLDYHRVTELRADVASGRLTYSLRQFVNSEGKYELIVSRTTMIGTQYKQRETRTLVGNADSPHWYNFVPVTLGKEWPAQYRVTTATYNILDPGLPIHTTVHYEPYGDFLPLFTSDIRGVHGPDIANVEIVSLNTSYAIDFSDPTWSVGRLPQWIHVPFVARSATAGSAFKGYARIAFSGGNSRYVTSLADLVPRITMGTLPPFVDPVLVSAELFWEKAVVSNSATPPVVINW